MSFEFAVPLARKDLLKRTSDTQYVVEEVLTIRQINTQIHGLKAAFRSGPAAILENFDLIYSVLSQLNEVETEVKEEVWTLLVKAVSQHASQLPALLDTADFDCSTRLQHLNTLKMTTYLLTQFMEAFEAEDTKPTTVTVTKGRKSKKKTVKGDWDWEGERLRAVQSLSQVVQLEIGRLWEPPVVEEEFVNMVANCCYKLLENPSTCKEKGSKDAVFHLLGTLVRRYNHGLGASLKIIQLLQHFEHLASPMAQMVELFAQQFGAKSVISDILRSLCNKMEELQTVLLLNKIQVAAITETWFNADMPTTWWDIDGYHLYSKPRLDRQGGGVAVYVDNDIPTQELDITVPDGLECLWVKARPKRLPRTIPYIVVCAVYIPPASPHGTALIEHLSDTVDTLRAKTPNVGMCIAGDFNRLDIHQLCLGNELSQIVDFPTRMTATLDLVITNMKQVYEKPSSLPPIGNSDHNIIILKARKPARSNKTHRKTVRPMPESKIRAFGQWITAHKWEEVINAADTQSKTNAFYDTILNKIDDYFPTKTITMHTTDKPWLTPEVKDLVHQRQEAFLRGSEKTWRELRIKIQKKIRKAKKAFYKDKVQAEKKNNPARWHQNVKAMLNTQSKGLTLNVEDINPSDHKAVANAVNNVFCQITTSLPPLDPNLLPAFLPAQNVPEVMPWEMYAKLKNIKSRKAAGPDGVSGRIIKEFAYELSLPMSSILNASIAEGYVPTQWRQANVVPLPKTNPPDLNELRPVSLTPILAKVSESFVSAWTLHDIKSRIDTSQFGCMAGRSTTHCLVDIVHQLAKTSDQPNTVSTLILTDFAKAFDRVDHLIAVSSLLDLGLRPAMARWIISFLSRRNQRVRYKDSVSDWKETSCGLPQGTVLGPIIFIALINSAAAISKSRRLTQAQRKQLEKVQRRAVRTILGHKYTNYIDSCLLLGLDTLETRRDHLCLAFAKKLMQSADFRQWFPQRRGDISGRSTREIGRMDPSKLVRDNSGTRSYAAFMVELAERVPALMLPNISVILCHLDGESYTMRNGVLGVMSEIVIKELSKGDLDTKGKSARDQFLDCLEEHIHDVNAFVRSKVLTLWLHICNEKAIPLGRWHQLLCLVVGRLQDKSSLVRKVAIQLLTTFLTSNPFGAKLPLDVLKAELEKESARLEEIMPEQPQDQPQDGRPVEEEWSAIQPEVMTALQDLQEEEEEEEQELIGEEDGLESVVMRVKTLLQQSQHKSAARLVMSAREAWPDEHIFLPANTGSGEEKEEKEEDDNELQPDQKNLLEILEAIFVGTTVDAPLPNPEEVVPASLQEGGTEEGATEGTAAETEGGEEGGVVNEVSKKQVIVQYLKDSVNFATQMQRAIPILCQLLGSKATSDILETIEFFVSAFEFGLAGAMEGVRRMLVLIWSGEKSVKEAVVEAYKRLYLSPTGGNLRARNLAVVKNLTALTVGATVGELTSLEELICELVRTSLLSSGVVTLLWERFALKIQGTTGEDSRGALLLLGMAAGAEADIVRSNVDVLVQEGLGQRGQEDMQLARDTCTALLKLAGSQKRKAGCHEEPLRFPADHDMFTGLANILVKGVENLANPYWIPLMEQGLNVVYRLSETPDVVIGNIIKGVAAVVLQAREAESAQKQAQEPESAETPEEPPASPAKVITCSSGVLSRLLALAGHCALRQLVHLDVALTGELKRRRMLQEERSCKAGRKGNTSANNTPSSTPAGKGKEDKEMSMEDEMGLAGASADDAEAEYIRKICEKEVVTGSSLLALLAPVIVAVCANPTMFPHPQLRATASLALAKYMLVSSEFCEAHLQLLFTILEKAPQPIIRANTIIALGDLSFRFPNLIEPWTPNLYARLRDDSSHVRKNTLMVLTHLILNDMLKVKGYISDMAACMVDEVSGIADLAKLFFLELSKKGNAIYNIMPDMVSRLSDPDCGVTEENFRTIMKYLFSFIQKDKQSESLVEKLCHRFRATRTERQARDLAFCLSMLSLSEKGVRKLQENFTCFGDKLGSEDIHNSFCTILKKAKSFAKPEVKALVDELEQRIEQCHNKGMSDDETLQKASKARPTGKKGGQTPGKGLQKGRTPGRRRRGRQASRKQDSSSEDDGPNHPPTQEEDHPAKRGMKGKKQKAGKKKTVSLSSDDESDIELFDVNEGSTAGEPDGESDQENADPRPNVTPIRRAKGRKHSKKHLSAAEDSFSEATPVK
ncbi:NCAPD2 [Branchiostoma lanceolatum]|uniref:Condensin complex subunit 1 n=1 Tax=Branchiostoma lanceolatum TaxID=7740 RepID=A0A8J9YSK2_BRALA|nr:NCAPD2 [Branchiostoma lanceolatum]